MQTIQSVLDRYKDTPTDKLPRIITTGHSLGGALAIVAAVFIAHWIPGYCEGSADYTSRKLQTYTFAAPRIGDENLSEYLSSTLNYKAVQVKNQPDVVPYVPPAGDCVFCKRFDSCKRYWSWRILASHKCLCWHGMT